MCYYAERSMNLEGLMILKASHQYSLSDSHKWSITHTSFKILNTIYSYINMHSTTHQILPHLATMSGI